MTIADRHAKRLRSWARVPAFLPLLGTWIRAVVSTKRVRPTQPRPYWGKPVWLFAVAASAVAAVVLAMVFLDAAAIARQRNLSRGMIDAFDVVTDFGRAGWVLTPLLIFFVILAVLSSRPMRRITQLTLTSVAVRVGYLFSAIAVPGILVAIIKRLIGRARPYSWETGGPFEFLPFDFRVEYASLPSGHGTTAFATAVAIAALFPRLRIPMLVLAVLVAISRVALSAHYPSDVIAGGCLGAFGAVVVRNWFATRRLGFYVAADRAVRPMPGPSRRRLRVSARRLIGR